MTLDQLETLVLSQRAAPEPWSPVTDYSYEARKAIEGDHPQLIKDVFQPTLAVDAGCGPDGILVKLLDEVGVNALGFDVQVPRQALDRRLIHASLLDWPGERLADVVICREVLEHLPVRDIRTAVTHLCQLTHQYVYVTTRFSSEHDLLRVETSDDLDPTHISLCAKDLIRLLFVLEGFKRRADLEERLDWKHCGRVLVYERVSVPVVDVVHEVGIS